MDLDELALWAAWLDEYDPQRRDDWRAGMIASVVANAHSRHGGFTPQDFMPQASEEQMSEEQVQRQLQSWCVNAGGKVRQRKRKKR